MPSESCRCFFITSLFSSCHILNQLSKNSCSFPRDWSQLIHDSLTPSLSSFSHYKDYRFKDCFMTFLKISKLSFTQVPHLQADTSALSFYLQTCTVKLHYLSRIWGKTKQETCRSYFLLTTLLYGLLTVSSMLRTGPDWPVFLLPLLQCIYTSILC